MNAHKAYLGDAVYCQFDGYHVVLTTEDGISVNNAIYLDDQVLAALQNYLKGLQKLKDTWRPPNPVDTPDEDDPVWLARGKL